MKNGPILVLAFGIICGAGCKTNPPPPPPLSLNIEPDSAYMAEWGPSIRYYRDLEERLKTYTKYSTPKRRRFYPFNRAQSVQLAYFDFKDSSGNRTLPKISGRVAAEKMNRLVRLDTGSVDTLTDILYNSGYRFYVSSRSRMGCYFPRNAILFLNGKHEVFEYLEICFDCHQFEKSREKVRFDAGDFNDDSLRLLEQFFQNKGLPTTGPND